MAFGAPVIAALSLATTAIGAGISAYGAYQQGQAQQQASQYQAQVARNNAIIAQQNANAVRQQAQVQAQDEDIRTKQERAAAAAALSASGFDINKGSQANVLTSVSQTGRLNSLRKIYAGDMKARDYLAQRDSLSAQAGLYDMQGSQASTTGTINAFTSIIGGASNFSNKWYDYNTAKVWG